MTAIRDAMETYSASEVVPFVATVLPVLVHLIKSGQPVFEREAPEQQLRHLILETIHRMPSNEHVRPLASDLVTTMNQLLRHDNEENAIVANKIVLDMFRSHRVVLEAPMQVFMDTILEMFKEIPELVRDTIESLPEPSQSPGSSPPKGGETVQPLAPSMRSFRVLADVPFTVVAVSDGLVVSTLLRRCFHQREL